MTTENFAPGTDIKFVFTMRSEDQSAILFSSLHELYLSLYEVGAAEPVKRWSLADAEVTDHIVQDSTSVGHVWLESLTEGKTYVMRYELQYDNGELDDEVQNVTGEFQTRLRIKW